MDNVSVKRIATLHPKVRSEVTDIITSINSAGVDMRITRAFATLAEQNALYQLYLKGGPKAAPPGLSYHNYGVAIDFCLLHKDGSVSFNMEEDMDHDKKADWMEVVNSFQYKGWKWGVSFGDNDHLEKSFGYSVQGLKHLKDIGQVDKDGYVILDNNGTATNASDQKSKGIL